MPQNKFALARYRLIDEILRRQESVKTEEIVKMCREKLGFRVTARTIQMDMYAMKNDSFVGSFLPICYCKKRKAYYYSEEPVGIFLALCLSKSEYLLLQEIKVKIENEIPKEDYQLYCSLLRKIEIHLNKSF